MGPLETLIRAKISAAFPSDHFALENESHKHGFSKGEEGHFKLLVVSEQFADTRALERHQKIFAILKNEMASGVHALAIKALTPEEATRSGIAFETPQCAHAPKTSAHAPKTGAHGSKAGAHGSTIRSNAPKTDPHEPRAPVRFPKD